MWIGLNARAPPGMARADSETGAPSNVSSETQKHTILNPDNGLAAAVSPGCASNGLVVGTLPRNPGSKREA